MAKLSSPHAGSLQFWPRKRAEKKIPSVNWRTLAKIKTKQPTILGILAYKVGMATVVVKDSTENSMTKGKKVFMPVTVLEVPPMKIYSVRFYKHGLAVKDVIVSHDKELKRIVRIPKEVKPFEAQIPKEYDDIRVLVYSLPKQANLKKTPDIAEVALSADNKLEFVKTHLHKELSIKDLGVPEMVDIRGLTRGKGLVGPVKRFGITLKQHKTEKGVRRPGSLGPWHPARVTFRTPMAGQLGMFSRVHYNQKVVLSGNASEKNINPKSGFKHYGVVKGEFIFVKGSVQGPVKRQLLLTHSFRPTKLTAKQKYEFQELVV